MRLRRKWIAAMTGGAFIVFLGGFWLLQGAAVISTCPILCFADCQCLTGGSTFWAAVGAITLAAGLAIVGLSARGLRK